MKGSGNNKHSRVQEIEFLSDQPLDVDKEQEMRFGHPSLVENLKNIVLICPTPYTIGLFGKWGTGKTTILDALKRRFHATEIAVVKIDAWKHEGDALRRTFLQDTVNQLQERQGDKQYLGTSFKLSENLRVPITRTFQSGIKLNRSLLRPLLIVLAVLVGIGFLIQALFPDKLGTYISTVLGGGLILGVLLWILQQSVTTETVTTTTDRFQDPQEFEMEFKKIIGRVAAKKLLLIIDNLDRVSCEKAVELLSTVKTFLEQRKCVFLMACDADAIKKHFESLYATDSENMGGVSAIDGDEFLRKFFNSYLIIPEFIDTELQSYAENLLRETKLSVGDLPDVAYVIAKAFRDNPRQIKQFINTLLSHFLLAEMRETSGELPEGSVTGNVAYLAKDLVIRLQFPEYYHSWTRREAINIGRKELEDFLRATRPIDVDDNRPFRYLKLSEEEIEMPEIRDLQFAIQDNNVESARQIIGEIQTDTRKLAVLNKFVFSFIDRNRGRGLLLFNIVSSTISALQELGIAFDKHFYHQVAELLYDDSQLGPQLHDFTPGVIFTEVLDRCDKRRREEIIHKYSGLFSDPDHIKRDDREMYIKDLLREFMDHKDWLNATRRQEIRSAIAQKYCNYEILSMFIGKPVEQKEFVHEETLSKFIGEISESDLQEPEQLRIKVNLLSDFEGAVTDKNLSEIITQFTGLLSTENSKPDRSEKHNLLASIDDIIDGFDERIANLDEGIINPFTEQILKGIGALGPLVQKRIFIPVCLWLVRVIADPLRSQISSAINKFFAGGSSEDLSFIFEKIKGKNEKEELIKGYANTFKQRVLGEQNIFDLLYPLAAKEIKTGWLTGLIQADHQRAIAKLEQQNYRVDDRKAVISAILTKINQLLPMQRESLYIACNKMKCANDVEAKEKLVSYIKAHLVDTTPDHQKMGLAVLQGATYLSQTHKRDIATETVEWLSALQPDSAYQPSSAQSILVTWPVLTWALKQKFLDYVFDKLIRRGINSQSIGLGFNILGRIEPKPKYEEYSAYFDDIFNRAETEPDPEMKSHLVKGLRSLKPGKLHDSNRSFWRRVRQLPTLEEP